MKKEYIGINTNKIHDELIASGINPLLIESLDEKTWITFTDNTDMDLVQQIIDSHDPTPPIPKSTLEERLAKLETENALLKTKVATIEATPTLKTELAIKDPIISDPIIKG